MGRRKGSWDNSEVDFFFDFLAGTLKLLFAIIIGLFKLSKTIIETISKEKEYKITNMAKVDRMEGIEFEKYVSFLMLQQGYSVKVTKASGDFGVDIIAWKTKYKYSVQVKRQASNVSRRAVSDAVAGKEYYNCNRSMVVTNSYFSKAAIEYAGKTNCKLIDRPKLAGWIKALQPQTNAYFKKTKKHRQKTTGIKKRDSRFHCITCNNKIEDRRLQTFPETNVCSSCALNLSKKNNT